MFNEPFKIDVKEKISKELERINFKHLKNNSLKRKQPMERMKTLDIFHRMYAVIKVKNKFKGKLKKNFKNQYSAFQGCTRILLIVGQCFGLNPVLGVFETDVSKIRFEILSLRHLCSVVLCIIQLIASVLCLNALIKNSVSVGIVAYLCFYFTTFYTNVLFMVLARRWRVLNKEVAKSELDEYINPYVRIKCIATIIIILSVAFFEHILSIISTLRLVMDCDESVETVFRKYVEKHFAGVLHIDSTIIFPAGFFVMFTNLMCTMNWNYSHVFVICMSIYLTSILEGLNRKLLSAEGQCLPAVFWKSLREDYNNATKLVRIFDNYINSIILVAFASNLFFVCLQLYYVLSTGLNFKKPANNECTSLLSGPFSGNEHVVYFCVSLTFVLSRSLAVLLFTSAVHTASLVPAPVLYAVPSASYGIEVQRFIEQVHGDTVALTGMNFFYVTRQLVLSVAGTIITYELVLLQFNADSAKSSYN